MQTGSHKNVTADTGAAQTENGRDKPQHIFILSYILFLYFIAISNNGQLFLFSCALAF